MNFRLLFFIFILTTSSIVWAQESGRGQTGNGGNGCWVQGVAGSEQEWRSIEELLFPELIYKEKLSYSKILLPLPNSNGNPNAISSFNLWGRVQKNKILKRFRSIKKSSPMVFVLMNEMSELFRQSYAVKTTVDGLYHADVSQISNCISFSPALLTFEDGTIIFFKPIWDKLDPYSSEIMLIHETIRLAQVFHPAFKDFSNADLQRLTALLFSRPIKQSEIDSLLEAVETRLNEGNFELKTPLPVNMDSEGFIDTKAAFENEFQKVLKHNRPSIKALNNFRIFNRSFKNSVRRKIKANFLSTFSLSV